MKPRTPSNGLRLRYVLLSAGLTLLSFLSFAGLHLANRSETSPARIGDDPVLPLPAESSASLPTAKPPTPTSTSTISMRPTLPPPTLPPPTLPPPTLPPPTPRPTTPVPIDHKYRPPTFEELASLKPQTLTATPSTPPLLAPLTGKEINSHSTLLPRAVAAKIDNSSPAARTQYGLHHADLVFEILVEGGTTRFMAIFHSDIAHKIGPIRSIRSTDFDLLIGLRQPYLASSGANRNVAQELRSAERGGALIDIGAQSGTPAYSVDSSRKAPHNRFFHYYDLVFNTASRPGESVPTPIFSYGSNGDLPGIPDTAGATIRWSTNSNTVTWLWDENTRGWVRIQNGEPHSSRGNAAIHETSPQNVVILWMSYTASEADPRSPQAVSFGTGEGLLLTGGKVHRIQWRRSETSPQYELTDPSTGAQLNLAAGQTWIAAANLGNRKPVSDVQLVSEGTAAAMLNETRSRQRTG